MKAFYILKPDMLENKEFLLAYREMIQDSKFMKSLGTYNLGNWCELASLLYDIYPSDKKQEDVIAWRKKMMITIMGYYKYYKEKEALIDIIDVPSDMLVAMEEKKKEYRKLYVYDRDKYFVNIASDGNISYNDCMSSIDLSKVNASYYMTKKGHDEEIHVGYNLILFNKIHSPDPTREDIERDMEIIRKHAEAKKLALKWR